MITRNGKAAFESFGDGVCSIRRMDENGDAAEEVESLRFSERVVGVKRYYEAMTNKVQIDRLIRVPYRESLSTEFLAVVKGQTYAIAQVQTVPDALPKSCDLSLHLARGRRV